MLQTIKYAKNKDWQKILQRPSFDTSILEKRVKKILDGVKKNGDKAISKYTRTYNGVALKKFRVTPAEFGRAEESVSPDLKHAIGMAKNNIEVFHASQIHPVESVETMPGVRCWRKNVAIEKVGLYIPGGTAPLFSTLLMLGIPASLAGCKKIVVCSPPDKTGSLPAALLYVARILDISDVFKIGGVQAIGAMAYGTRTVPAVDKVFGPGNQYIASAKQLIQKEGIAIDMTAGPSEIALFADQSADISYTAADILSQAEHGADSQVILVTDSEAFSRKIKREIKKQLKKLPRKEIAVKSLEKSKIIVTKNSEEAMEVINQYAPEHLMLNCKNAQALADKVINAGSVFLGNYSPESAGDYASGTNHTLPTNSHAKASGGVSVDSFVKKITFQQLSADGLAAIGKTVEMMAQAEGLYGHAESIRIRLRPGSLGKNSLPIKTKV